MYEYNGEIMDEYKRSLAQLGKYAIDNGDENHQEVAIDDPDTWWPFLLLFFLRKESKNEFEFELNGPLFPMWDARASLIDCQIRHFTIEQAAKYCRFKKLVDSFFMALAKRPESFFISEIDYLCCYTIKGSNWLEYSVFLRTGNNNHFAKAEILVSQIKCDEDGG